MKYCIGPMNVRHMYIYICQVCPVAPKNLRVIFASILHSFNQNIKFLYNMQCVIIILYYSQKMQWSMRIGLFLERRKISVEGTCSLQVAICLTFL